MAKKTYLLVTVSFADIDLFVYNLICMIGIDSVVNWKYD